MTESVSEKIERLQRTRSIGNLSLLQELRLMWLNLPDWAKSLAARSFVGFAVMWLVTHVAVYYYALKFGMQVPLEGVPFLVVVSLAASAAISVFSAMNIGIQSLNSRTSANQEIPSKAQDQFDPVEATDYARTKKNLESIFEKPVDILSEASRRAQLIRSIVLISNYAVVTFMASTVLFYLFVSSSSLLNFILNTYTSTRSTRIFEVLIFGFVLAIVLWRVYRLTRVAPGIVGNVIYFVGLFLVGSYISVGGGTDHILRVTKFGGGIDVDIASNNRVYLEASLMLQTNSTIVVWDRPVNEFVWIPLASVESMDFAGDPEIKTPATRPWFNRLGFKSVVPINNEEHGSETEK